MTYVYKITRECLTDRQFPCSRMLFFGGWGSSRTLILGASRVSKGTKVDILLPFTWFLLSFCRPWNLIFNQFWLWSIIFELSVHSKVLCKYFNTSQISFPSITWIALSCLSDLIFLWPIRELSPMGWQSYLFRTVGSFIILSERNEYVPLMSLCFSVIILP